MKFQRSAASRDIPAEYDEHAVTVAPRKHEAAGVRAVMVSMQRGLEQMGALRTAAALARLNQRNGFDCPGCAWPEEHGGRKVAEFCENGAKAVAEEATKRTVTPEFFARHSIGELSAKPEYWLSQQGRLAHPMVLRPGDDHYRPISWDAAYQLIAEQLNALDSPDRAVFYTSGRTSNEAAFCYQLLVRSFGTNNLPDCSNMCHESSGSALTESIGIGKGSVTVEDVELADLIIIAGQNPGSNHPRMLTVLEKAKANGAKIIAVNPLPEAGLIRFKDPQTVKGVVGQGISIADEFVQIRLGGDMALFAGLGRLLLEADERAPGSGIDQAFVDQHCAGFDEYRRHTLQTDIDTVLAATGIDRAQLERVAAMLMASQRTVVCWAMGLTQHTHAVATIGEITNLLLLRGMIGKPGAGVCPVRGHSNVQGDRTMGIWEKMPEKFLASLDREFGIASPRKHGYDTVTRSVPCATGERRFHRHGWQLRLRHPRHGRHRSRFAQLRVDRADFDQAQPQPSGSWETALILPTLGRTDRDIRGGRKQLVSVEDSMSMVHLSRGSLQPPSDQVRSEVEIVCQLARTLLGPQHPVPWERFADDYDAIRDAIAAVVPGCADYNRKVRAARRIPAAAPAARCARIPDQHRKSQLCGQSAAVGAGAAGPPGAADDAQPRPVQHHDLRARRPISRSEGRSPGGVHQPRRHRDTGSDRRRPRRPGVGVDRRRAPATRTARERFSGGGVFDSGRQRRGLLSGDQSTGSAGPHRGQVEHAGVQGDHHPSGVRLLVRHVTARRRVKHLDRRPGDHPTGNPGRRGAAGDPRQRRAGHRDHAHTRIGYRTRARVSAHRRGRSRAREDVQTIRYCDGRGEDGANTYNVLDVTLAPGVTMPDLDVTRNFYTTSSCGVCGKASLEAVRLISRFSPGDDPATVAATTLKAMPDQLRGAQKVFASTGGLHAAALFGVDGTMFVGAGGHRPAQRGGQGHRLGAGTRPDTRWAPRCCWSAGGRRSS